MRGFVGHGQSMVTNVLLHNNIVTCTKALDKAKKIISLLAFSEPPKEFEFSRLR